MHMKSQLVEISMAPHSVHRGVSKMTSFRQRLHDVAFVLQAPPNASLLALGLSANNAIRYLQLLPIVLASFGDWARDKNYLRNGVTGRCRKAVMGAAIANVVGIM